MYKALVLAIVIGAVVLAAGCVHGIPVSSGISADGDHDGLVVQTDTGAIKGQTSGLLRNGKEWLGVPFAKPPTGELRFRSPQAANPWQGVKDATTHGPCCPQSFKHNESSISEVGCGPYSEDCLYLNIYAPKSATADKPLPVMFFIHGGSFVSGGGSVFIYSGRKDALRDDVVFVTINYRLGPFGFLGSESLRDPTTGSSGNWGIEDQRMALQWVQRNIHNFGGDPTKVFMFGESAGAGSTTVHLVSKPSMGLYRAAGMESGAFASWGFKDMEWAEVNYQAALQGAGCDPSSTAEQRLACLQAASEETIRHSPYKNVGPSSRKTGKGVIDVTLKWAPVVDGVVLEKRPYELGMNGSFFPADSVSALLGSNHDEATMFIDDWKHITTEQYEQSIPATYPDDMAATVQKLYPVGDKYKTAYEALTAMWTDRFMACPSRRGARWLAQSGHPTFLYQFDHTPTLVAWDKYLKTFHGSELVFTLENTELMVTPGEHALGKVMAEMWGKMAYDGQPANQKTWPAYSAVNDANIRFTAGALEAHTAVVEGLKKKECDFWDKYLEWS